MANRIRTYARNRRMAGLLAVLLLGPFAIKSAHSHCVADCSETSEAAAHHHDCDNCPICHFTLSYFIDQPATGIVPVRTLLSFTPVPMRETPCRPYRHSPSPRAPPSGSRT
jgi:hypothetical protein